MKLIIASHNAGKIKEFKALFEPFDLEVVSLFDYPDIEEVAETGDTFEANARLKAETIAKELGCIAIADDSGLVVDVLDGAPGVYSARYSGEPKDDQRNNQKLLDAMKSFDQDQRRARFVSCIVAAYPNYDSLVVHGQVEGRILQQAQGETGFGYDPLFYYEPAKKTFAQMSLSAKNDVSHRGNAVKALMQEFESWMGGIPQ